MNDKREHGRVRFSRAREDFKREIREARRQPRKKRKVSETPKPGE